MAVYPKVQETPSPAAKSRLEAQESVEAHAENDTTEEQWANEGGSLINSSEF